jgi:hypothetical protein
MTKTPPPAPPHKGEGSTIVKATPEPRKKKSWHDSLPFPRHWLAYVILKLAVIALAVYLVLRFMGRS